ncbi:MAG: class I SAM-dependent methyltransferase [Clostridiales Family XIII bacterium]|jgi:SAM-dependent methyltransferase|nr:class I SAM-dependent methyltransferase [Clostridiales Family XIII bacterium]
MTKNEELANIQKRHSWAKITTTVANYVEPAYYDKLLKDYIFQGKTDLQIFNEILNTVNFKTNANCLELGPGSGRATSIFLSKINVSKLNSLTLVDLSKRMLDFCKLRFKNISKIDYINSDSINFIFHTNNKYNFVFSLWSLSHSIHQVLTNKGLELGSEYIKHVIQKLVNENMYSNASIFLIHFDSMSDEQKILMRQWKKVFPIYHDTKHQSPSKLLLDSIFNELEQKKIIKQRVIHYIGQPIIYSSLEEALEIFCNFHMESFFNESILFPNVINELTQYFKRYTNQDNSISIKPGCFIYKITKI